MHILRSGFLLIAVVAPFLLAFSKLTRDQRLGRIGICFGACTLSFLSLSWLLFGASGSPDGLLQALSGETWIVFSYVISSVIAAIRKSSRPANVRVLLAVGALIVIVFIGYFIVLRISVFKQAARAEAAWEKSGLGPLSQVPGRFPKQKANDSAQQMEQLVSHLGIDLVPRTSNRNAHPSREEMDEFQQVKKQLQTYLEDRINSPEHTSLPAPEPVLLYLQKHGGEVQRVITQLHDNERPAWETDLGGWVNAPLPQLLGHLAVQRLLAVHAIVKSDHGDIEQAELALEASWKLNESLSNRPEEISLLVSMAVFRLQAAVLRQIRPLPEIWQMRMSRPELTERYLYAQQTGAWAFQQAAKKGDMFNGAASDQGPYSNYVSSLHFRLSVAKLSERTALATQELASQSPCTPRRELSSSETRAFFPGDSDAHIGYVDPAGGWNKTARTILEMELTAEVLMIHEMGLRESRDFPSSVCPGEKWTYRTSNGKGTLSFSKEIDWAGLAPPDCCSSGQQPQSIPLIHIDDLQ